MSLRAEGEAIFYLMTGDCFGLCPRNDIEYFYFTLQPTPHAGLVADICFPKLFLQISFFTLNDKFIAKQNKYWSKDNPPIRASIKWNADDHQEKAKINWVARETINT